jgi:hypothetical protein
MILQQSFISITFYGDADMVYTVRTDFLNKAYVPPRTRVASHFSRCCGANGW